MSVVRWTNLMCGVALVLAALAFLLFLPGNVADYLREPEDAWLSAFWLGLIGLIAALCFTNARSNRPVGWRILANVLAVTALGALFVIGGDDPAVPPLLALCALGPLAALVGAWGRPQIPQP